MVSLVNEKCIVSIPKRVLEALNPDGSIFYQSDVEVSIPKRVLEALNPTEGTDDREPLKPFQSLKGF